MSSSPSASSLTPFPQSLHSSASSENTSLLWSHDLIPSTSSVCYGCQNRCSFTSPSSNSSSASAFIDTSVSDVSSLIASSLHNSSSVPSMYNVASPMVSSHSLPLFSQSRASFEFSHPTDRSASIQSCESIPLDLPFNSLIFQPVSAGDSSAHPATEQWDGDN